MQQIRHCSSTINNIRIKVDKKEGGFVTTPVTSTTPSQRMTSIWWCYNVIFHELNMYIRRTIYEHEYNICTNIFIGLSISFEKYICIEIKAYTRILLRKLFVVMFLRRARRYRKFNAHNESKCQFSFDVATTTTRLACQTDKIEGKKTHAAFKGLQLRILHITKQ